MKLKQWRNLARADESGWCGSLIIGRPTACNKTGVVNCQCMCRVSVERYVLQCTMNINVYGCLSLNTHVTNLSTKRVTPLVRHLCTFHATFVRGP